MPVTDGLGLGSQQLLTAGPRQVEEPPFETLLATMAAGKERLWGVLHWLAKALI